MKERTILFDLGDVLIRGLFGLEKEISKVTGKDPNFIFKKLGGANLDALFLGEISEEQYWLNFIDDTELGLDISILKKLVRKNFQIDNEVLKIIQNLYSKGYTLYLLSSHSKEWISYCQSRFNYEEYFTECFYSYEFKMLKSNIDLYAKVLDKINKNTKTKEIIFIDDSKSNIDMARKAGMNGIHFSSHDDLYRNFIDN